MLDDLGEKSLEKLNLSPEIEQKLKEIHGSLRDAYAEQFMAMMSTIKEQATALRRIQETLNVLVSALAPHLSSSVKVPIGVQVVPDGAQPDLATALVVADPMGAGFTMNQSELANALAPGVTQPDISILLRAFGLNNDAACAVTVRSGKSREMVNYHPRTVGRIRQFLIAPPRGLKPHEKKAVDRVLRRISP